MHPAILRALGPLVAAASLCLAGHVQAQAQAFPTKPIRLVIPYAAGGGTDVVGRALAEGMSRELGQSVIVDNKPGAGTVIGTDAVAKSAPDGYTIVFASPGHAINVSLMPKLPYNTRTDFAAIGMIGSSPIVVVVRPDGPFKTPAEMREYVRKSNGKATFGSAGNGTGVHLAGELYKFETGLEMVHVPYKGGAPSIADLLGGQIDMVYASAASAAKFIESGLLKAVAVTSAKRSPAWPQVPTFAESGLPSYVVETWYGLFVPAATPREVVMRLNAALRTVTASAAFQKSVTSEGLVISTGSPEEFDRFEKAEEDRWAKVVKERRLTAN